MAADLARLVIEADSRQIRAANRDLDGLERRGKTVQDRFTGMGRTAQRLGRQLTTWLTLPLLASGGMAIKTAADYETLRTQLEVLVGSAEVANQVFKDLTEFAATTPFEIDGIVRANNLLLGFGVSIEETQGLLAILGDIAAVSGGDLFSMARVTGEARAEGKLLTRDLRQLIAQGVPIIKLLADSMGVAENKIFDMASAGQIGFTELTDAFKMATSEGGLFFEGMGKRSDTLAGIFSNFFDSVNISLSSFGQNLIETLEIKELMRALVEDIESATEWFDNLDSSTQRMIISFGILLAAIGPVLGILGTLSLAIGAISAPVLAVVAVTGLAAATIMTNWEKIEAYFTTGGGRQMWLDLQSIVDSTAKIITGIWKEFGDEFILLTEFSFGTVLKTVEKSLENISSMMKAFNGEFSTELNIWEDNLLTTARKVDNILVGTIARALQVSSSAIMRAFRVSAAAIMNVFGPAVSNLDKFIEDSLFFTSDWVFPEQIEKTTKAVDELAESVKSVAKVRVPNPVPEDRIIDIDRAIDKFAELNDIIADMERDSAGNDFTHRLFPPGSVGELQGRIQVLREELQFAFNPEDVQSYQDQIAELEAQLASLTGNGIDPMKNAIASLQNPMERFLADSIVGVMNFKEETRMVVNEFGELEEQTITLKDKIGDLFESLLKDIQRTLTQLLIVRPLMDSLFGAGRGSGTIGGLLGSLVGSGESTSVNDALITNDGKVIHLNPKDHLLAFQDGSPTVNSVQGGPANVNVNVINNSGAEVEMQERRGADGSIDIDILLERKVKGMFDQGKLDTRLSRFGANRQPTRRG